MFRTDTAFIISQILASFAFIAGVSSFQFQRREHVLRIWCISSALASLHFFLLGNTTAGVLVCITSIRFLCASFHPSKSLMYLFMALITISLPFTFERPLNILAFASSLLGTYGAFQQKDLRVRAVLFICASCWATHNVIAGSPAAAVMETFFLCSNAVGIYRYYGRPQAEPLRIGS